MAIGGALFGLIYAASTNPADERALQCRLNQLRQQMLMIPMGIHSPKAGYFLINFLELEFSFLDKSSIQFLKNNSSFTHQKRN
jgi:hypothetical protein